MLENVMSALSTERGHFLLESGFHGAMWMNLETLFLRPEKIEPLAITLATRVRPIGPEIVCAPLVEGAFLGLMIARALDLPFTYSERYEQHSAGGLYPFGYRVPVALRTHLARKRVLIVNDVISAGSAVQGTIGDVRVAGGVCVGIASLLVLGEWTAQFATAENLTTEALAKAPYEVWSPGACPLCATGTPLERRVQSE